MRLSFAFGVLLGLTLPACFASTGPRECAPNPCRGGEGTEVASCEGYASCIDFEWCGETVYCASIAEPPPRPPACDPRPVCADSIEVESCEGWDNCFPTEWCGTTLYCASNNACTDPAVVCAPDEIMSDVPCSPLEVGCEDSTICGETVACRIDMECFDPIFDPCSMATSLVVGGGEGSCPDFGLDLPCYETMYCGDQLHYCQTACPYGAERVSSPRECRNANDCYSVDYGRDDLPLFWCQGNGPVCRALPDCDGGQEIPLNSPCPDFSICDYRSVCSTTIQCAWPEIVVG